MKILNKDLTISLIIGEIVAWLIWPIWLNLGFGYWELRWWLLLIMPILFVLAVLISKFLGRFIPILWQLVKFGLIGVLNTLLDFAVLNLLSYLTKVYSGKELILLNIVAFVIANLNSYFWNKFWTFNSKTKNVASEFGKFILVSVIGFAINSVILWFMTTIMSPMGNLSAPLWENVAKLLATVVYMIWNFFGYKLIVFKKKVALEANNS